MYFYVLVFIIGTTAAVRAAGETSGEHRSHHHTAETGVPGEPRLNHGKKWETDAPLREGMSAIRDALESDLEKALAGTLSPENYAGIAGRITSATEGIFKNCKLAPQADQVLHGVLAKILGGAGKMKDGGSAEKRKNGAEEVRNALLDYPKTFRHTGWRPLVSSGQ